jgi:hypothetical protein
MKRLEIQWKIGSLNLAINLASGRSVNMWGSSQSKEADDRLEEKIDLLIQRLDSEKGKRLIQELDKKYTRKG